MKKIWDNFKLFLFIAIFIAIVLLMVWVRLKIGLFFYKFRTTIFLISLAVLCLFYGFAYYVIHRK